MVPKDFSIFLHIVYQVALIYSTVILLPCKIKPGRYLFNVASCNNSLGFLIAKLLQGEYADFFLLSESPNRDGNSGTNPVFLYLALPPYTEALVKDGILLSQEQSAMHRHAEEGAYLFTNNFNNPEGLN